MIIRPDDIVRPTPLCIETIRKFREYHRGRVVGWPHDRVITVVWSHQLWHTVPMATRYVEKVID